VVLVNTARPDGVGFSFRRLIHSLKTHDSTVLVYRQTNAEIVNTLNLLLISDKRN
jgi:hypothetical protein